LPVICCLPNPRRINRGHLDAVVHYYHRNCQSAQQIQISVSIQLPWCHERVQDLSLNAIPARSAREPIPRKANATNYTCWNIQLKWPRNWKQLSFRAVRGKGAVPCLSFRHMPDRAWQWHTWNVVDQPKWRSNSSLYRRA
jgi:hypothetical protein